MPCLQTTCQPERHKTRGHEMKVVISWTTRNVSRQQKLVEQGCPPKSTLMHCRLPRTKAVTLSLAVLSGGTVFRLSWFPCCCVVTTASTSIAQYLESEEVVFSVVHVHRAPLLRKNVPMVTCLTTQRSIPKILSDCPASLVPVDVVGL